MRGDNTKVALLAKSRSHATKAIIGATISLLFAGLGHWSDGLAGIGQALVSLAAAFSAGVHFRAAQVLWRIAR